MVENAKQLPTEKLKRYVNELPAGHACFKCWRCACHVALRERMQTGHLLVEATKNAGRENMSADAVDALDREKKLQEFVAARKETK